MLSGIEFTIAFWIATTICYKVSGSHLNPAVTLAMWLKKGSKQNIWMTIWYWIAQVVGMLLGVFLAFMFLRTGNTSIKVEAWKYVFQAMVMETFASFLFVFVFLLQSDPKNNTGQNPAVQGFIIAGSYVAMVTLSSKQNGGSVNPWYGMWSEVTGAISNKSGTDLQWVWMYLGMPMLGAFLAVLFYDFVFQMQHNPPKGRKKAPKLEVSEPPVEDKEEPIDDEEANQTSGHLNESNETPMLEESKAEG